jgi:alpha-L-fucosidase
VENYNIRSNTEGVRGGLDKWPGTDHLTLGVWDDKQNAPTEADIANARIYRLVELPAGSYFFGATYETIYNLGESYVFASTEEINTSDIPEEAFAYMRIAECQKDNQYWGIRFTLNESQEVMLGWQADLLNSSAQQEFRAAKVLLATYTSIDTDIEYAEQHTPSAPSIYTLQGVHITAPFATLPQGIYIVNGKKVVK